MFAFFVWAAPRGLLPNEQVLRSTSHDAVVRAARHDDDNAVWACRARLVQLRRLIASGHVDEAVDLSVALDAATRALLPVECSVDRPHAGFAEIAVAVSTPQNRSACNRSSFIRLEERRDFVPLVGDVARSTPRAAVAGFELDDAYVLAESPLLCRSTGTVSLRCDGAGKRDVVVTDVDTASAIADRLRGASSRVVDDDPWVDTDSVDEINDYAVGTKKVLLTPLCPADYWHDCAAAYGDRPMYDDGVHAYIANMVRLGTQFLEYNSFGKLTTNVTITAFLNVTYTQAQCSSVHALRWYNDRDPNAFDMMARAAAEDEGYDLRDFDILAVFIPLCADLGWSGNAWVGYPGLVINGYAVDYDGTYVHELGHNFGANHAGALSGGSRGQVAYQDSPTTWTEYGNPHTTMGSGRVEAAVENGEIYYVEGVAEFLVVNKMVFDWIADDEVATVQAYDFSAGTALCHPCGPLSLRRTDAGTFPGYAAIRIACQYPDRYFFLEHREVTTEGPGVLVTWTTMRYTYGGTGSAEKTVLTDATPHTDSFADAAIVIHSNYTVYLGSADEEYPVHIVVDDDASYDDVLVTIYSNAPDVPTSAPTLATPPPQTSPQS